MSWLFDRRLREKVKAGLIREPEVEESYDGQGGKYSMTLDRSVSRFQGGERVTAEISRLVFGHCLYGMTGNCKVCTVRRATGYACDGAMPSTVSFPRRGSTYFTIFLLRSRPSKVYPSIFYNMLCAILLPLCFLCLLR
jgi:hypothetical protein